MRTVILGLIALGLAVAVFLVWPGGSEEEPTETTVPATSTSPAETATTLTAEVTTTTGDSHVVETVEEAEEILRELWFGWFEGIYNQDEERIREVVGNPNQVAAAVAQFGVMEFDAEPRKDSIGLSQLEILRTDKDCLAIWGEAAGSFRQGSISGVHVFRWSGETWLLVNTWTRRDDLWEDDCDAVLP